MLPVSLQPPLMVSSASYMIMPPPLWNHGKVKWGWAGHSKDGELVQWYKARLGGTYPLRVVVLDFGAALDVDPCPGLSVNPATGLRSCVGRANTVEKGNVRVLCEHKVNDGATRQHAANGGSEAAVQSERAHVPRRRLWPRTPRRLLRRRA